MIPQVRHARDRSNRAADRQLTQGSQPQSDLLRWACLRRRFQCPLVVSWFYSGRAGLPTCYVDLQAEPAIQRPCQMISGKMCGGTMVVVIGALLAGCSSPSVPAAVQQPISLRIHVVDAALRSIAGARIQVSNQNGTVVQATPLVSDLNGNAVLTLAAPSTIALLVSRAGFESFGWFATVSADTELQALLSTTQNPTTIGPNPSPPSPGPPPLPPPGVAAPDLPSFTTVGNRPVCAFAEIVHPAACEDKNFGDATAICSDGERSCSEKDSGTCSSHNGVYCWVCPGPLCPQ